MESLAKILELVSRSIQSLRWPALIVVVCSAYLRYAPVTYQPFVSQSFLHEEERLEWLGLALVVSAVIFVFGWLAAGVERLLAQWAKKLEAAKGQEAATRQQQLQRAERHAQE